MSTRGTAGGWCRSSPLGVAAFGAAKYYELIFEREHAEHTTAPVGASRARAGRAEQP